MQPLVWLIDYLILGDDKRRIEAGIVFAPQISGYSFMHWPPMLTDHDHDVATGLHPNNIDSNHARTDIVDRVVASG